MNKLILILLILTSLVSCNSEEKTYCGIVSNKFQTSAGYKVQEKAFVVFYNEELRRNIAVEVTWNCYVNTEIGKNVCFTLTEFQLNH